MRKGFTLIEVLLVVLIMGILMTVSIYTWSSVSKRSRNNVRKSDTERIRGVLQQYYTTNRAYPVLNSGAFIADCQLNQDTKFTALLSSVPQDPSHKTGSCSAADQRGSYLYLAPSGAFPNQFALGATLETSDAMLNSLLGYDISDTRYFNQNYSVLGTNGR